MTTPVCHVTRGTGSNTTGRKCLFSHIIAFRISLSVRYTNKIEVIKFVQEKKMKLIDVLLSQQFGENRRHYSHLHLAGEVRY